MDNIFQIGGQAAGSSFIGRKTFVGNLRKNFLDGQVRMAKSFVGLTRIGKTSAVAKAFEDVPKDVLYIYENLNEWGSYIEIWQDICCEIRRYLLQRGELDAEVGTYLSSMEDEALKWIVFSRNIKRIFEYLAGQEIKTILVLDEFDNAATLFEKETKYFELFRTLFSSSKFHVFAITISRRNLYTIEEATYQSSTFHGVLDIVPFKGFDAADMAEYFAVFERQGIGLNEEQKEKIIYYAGNLPYLLSVLGHYIMEAAEAGEAIDIDSIFLNRCKTINDYYRDCLKHLERDGDLKRIVPFIVGPNIGVTQNDKDELFNLGYFREENGELIAIAKYFADFLSANMVSLSIWDNIIGLEKKLKLLIEKELPALVRQYRAGGDKALDIQRVILRRTKEISRGDLARYDAFIANNKKVFNIDSTYLDVMSMADAVKILKANWQEIFSKYFGNALFSALEHKFAKCVMARNPVAHGHEEYLTELDKREVDVFCKQFFDLLSGAGCEMGEPEESYVEVAKNFPADTIETAKLEPFEKPPQSLLNQKVRIYVFEKGSRKNLRCRVEGKYLGTISQTYLAGRNLDDFIGKTFEGTVERVDEERVGIALGQPAPTA